jgi:RNA polymerase sigma factor (sigma-70 family)
VNMEPNDSDGRVPDVDFMIGPVDSTAIEFIAVEATSLVQPLLPFEDFYREQRATIGRALAVTLRDTQLAADAIDEAMARAYQRWGRVQALDNPGGWVYRVGLNWSRSFLRRSRRPAPIWMTSSGVTVDGSALDPTIERALAQLSVEQRAVVACRLLMGYSESQTAIALDLRPGTVKSRLARATARLQSLLSPLDPANKDDHQ